MSLPNGFSYYTVTGSRLGIGRDESHIRGHRITKRAEWDMLYAAGIHILSEYIKAPSSLTEGSSLRETFHKLYKEISIRNSIAKLAVYDIARYPKCAELYKKYPKCMNPITSAPLGQHEDDEDRHATQISNHEDHTIPDNHPDVAKEDAVEVHMEEEDIEAAVDTPRPVDEKRPADLDFVVETGATSIDGEQLDNDDTTPVVETRPQSDTKDGSTSGYISHDTDKPDHHEHIDYHVVKEKKPKRKHKKRRIVVDE